MDVRSPFFQNIALIVAGVMFLNPIVASAAQLTVDAQAGGNTTLGQAGNGVPIVNIATPNGSGLSHNKFTDYNVGQQGLILNNATERLQSTQQGGIIIGNPNLQGRAAGVILNEVTGSNRSQLKGYTEVAGQAAHVIVANSHGITCDGCGFINTPRATLTTGAPVVDNGRLQGFDVKGGDIAIEGAGLNAGNIDQFDLITRSAQINAEIHAKRLNVIAGRNEVDVATLQATTKADDSSSQPQLAIDSSALGGMYAGAIRLVGTEAGVGVKLAGDMAASAGDIQIDANGKLTLGQTSASGNLAIAAQEVALNGKTYAAGNVGVGAQGELKVQQSLASGGEMTLEGAQIFNLGVIEAGVGPDNNRTAADLKISGQDVRNSGTLLGNGQLHIEVVQRLDNQGGTLSGNTLTRIETGHLDNRQGRVVGQAKLGVATGSVDNREGQVSARQLDISVRDEGALDNRQGNIFAEERLNVVTGSLNNSDKGSVASKGTLDITLSGHLDNHAQGTLASQGTQSIRASSVDNSSDGLISSRSSLSVSDAAIDNQNGRILADDAISLRQGTLSNQGGVLSGKTRIDLDLAHLDNRNQGRVSAKGDLEARVGHLEQRGGGELLSQGNLSLDATKIDNREGGLIGAVEGLQISAREALLNAAGEISTPGKALIRVQSDDSQSTAVLNNSDAGLIVGDQSLELYAQRLLNNAKGVLSGRDGLTLSSGSLDNSAGGTLTSRNAVNVKVDGILANHDQGKILSGTELHLEAGSIDNGAGGLLSSASSLNVKVGELNNQGGTVVSDRQLTIQSSSLDNGNAGAISSGQALDIKTGQIDNNNQGLITAADSVTVNASELNNQDHGVIASKGVVEVTTSALNQHGGGQLISETALTLDLQGGDLDNSSKGLITTPGALLLRNFGKVNNNAGGEISSNQGFRLQARELENRGGSVISAQDLQLQISQALINSLKGVLSANHLKVTAGRLDNSSAGVLASKSDIQLMLTGALFNSDHGLISATHDLSIESSSLDNSNEGVLVSDGAMEVVTGTLNNQAGRLLSHSVLDINSGNLDNRGGVLSSREAFTLNAGSVDNRDSGLITSADALNLTATRLDSSRHLGSRGGELSAKKDMQLTVTELIQRQGRLIGEAGVNIDLNGGDLDNRGGLLTANGPLSLQALGKLDNRDGGEISSKLGYLLRASTLDNGEQGRIISAGQLDLDVGNGTLRNAAGGLISGWQGVQIAAGNLDNNVGGTVSSREGALSVKLAGGQRILNNSDEGALVSKGVLEVEAASLNNSTKGIVSSGGDLDLRLTGTLDNSDDGQIDTQGALTVNADTVNNNAGQIGSSKAASLNAATLDNRAGQLASNAALGIALSGNLLNDQLGKLASVGPLVLKANAIDNQNGSLISQSLLDLTAITLNNANGGIIAAQTDLNLLLTGGLNNASSGMIHSQQGSIGIRAQRLDNTAGILSSQGDLLLALDGQLDNQKGQIQSRDGNLDVQRVTSVDNRDGVLSSLSGWLKLISAGLFDNDGGTTQAQTLGVSAQGVNNRGGHISASTGSTSIDLGDATFNNQGGGLYAHLLLDLIAGDFNNQGSAPGQGGKVAAGRIDFGLSGTLNNAYGIAESTSSLSLVSAGLDNRFGSLRALGSSGDTHISANSLDNRDGRIETANTDLMLDADSLQNHGGSILHVGTGKFGLSAAQVLGAGGDLSTNGSLRLTADSWINSGVLQAGRLELNIGNFTQTTSGQLLASQSLTGIGGTWVNDGLLASDGTFSLDLTGTYSGAGQLNSLGDLSLKAAGIDLAADGLIRGGAVSTIGSTGTLTNRGRLTSAGALTVKANVLNNYGTLGGGETLKIYSPTITNENGLIFSSGNMALRVDDLTNRYADIYGFGEIDVAGDDYGTWTTEFSNLSGNVESGGNLTIRSRLLENKKDQFEVMHINKSTAIGIRCFSCSRSTMGHDRDSHLVWVSEFETQIAKDSPSATLVAGRDLQVDAGEFVNSASQVSAGRDFSARAERFENSSFSTSSGVNYKYFQLTPSLSMWKQIVSYNSYNDAGYAGDFRFWNASGTESRVKPYYQVTGGEPAGRERYQYVGTYKLYLGSNYGWNPNKDPNLVMEGGKYSSGIRVEAPAFIQNATPFSEFTIGSTGPGAAQAVIQAGRNINITASDKISNGVEQAGSTLGETAQRVVETSVSKSTRTVFYLNKQLPPDLQQKQVNPLSLPGFALPQGSNGLFRLSDQTSTSLSSSTVQGVPTGASQASYQTLPSFSTGKASQTPETITAKPLSTQNDQGAAGLPGIDLPKVVGVQSLPVASAPPVRHKYLIETNPVLTDFKQFVSSDYLLGNLGYDPDHSQKRLGDGLYEQRLVREAIVARTGQRYLAGLTSDEAMFRYLMDNAVASKDRLNLSLGVTLSAEQVAALTHDIVWLEEHEVAGEKVLVPVLYLAQAEGRLAANGALIQGSEVKLISGGELVNQGTLRASENLTATAGNITNAGLLEASNRLQLLATESIRNAMGGIIAGRDVGLTAQTGDVINDRSVTRHEVSYGGHRTVQDFADNAARIEAVNNLQIVAGRDVRNVGGSLDSRGDLGIAAGRDVNITSIESRVSRSIGSRFLDEQVTQLGAEVKAGQDLDIRSGRDLAVVASQVNALRDLDMKAGEDLLISSAANESHFLSRSKKVTQSRDQITQQSSDIQAGRNLSLEAGNDLTVVASNVRAENDVDIDAGNDVQVLSAKDESASYYFKKKKGSFGRSKTTQAESYDSTNIASVIEAGNDLTINTSKTADGSLSLDGGRDVTVIGSQLSAGNDLLVGGTGDVAVLSGVEEHGSYSKKTKSGFLGLSKSGKSQLKTSATQVASELEAGNDVVIAAGNDIRLRASTTDAGNDVELRAGLIKDTGDVNLVSANDKAYSLQQEYKQKVGPSLSGGMLSFASAKKTGQEAQSSTSVGSQVSAERDATLNAERDINIVGSGVSAGRNVALGAGRDVNIVASSSESAQKVWEESQRIGIALGMKSSSPYTSEEERIYVGDAYEATKNILGVNTQSVAPSLIQSGQDMLIDAGRDVQVNGSQLLSGGDAKIEATRDIRIASSTQTHEITETDKTQNYGGGLLKSPAKGPAGIGVMHDVDYLDGYNRATQQIEIQSAISAEGNLTLKSGRDTEIAGANLVADSVKIDAGRDIHIHSPENKDVLYRDVMQGGVGLAVGLRPHEERADITSPSIQPSSIVATSGDITLSAGQDVKAQGAALLADRDVVVEAVRDALLSGASVSYDNRNDVVSNSMASVDRTHADFNSTASAPLEIQAGRDISISAGQDVIAKNLQAEAGRDIDVVAGRDLTIGATHRDRNNTTNSLGIKGDIFGLGEMARAFSEGKSASEILSAAAQSNPLLNNINNIAKTDENEDKWQNAAVLGYRLYSNNPSAGSGESTGSDTAATYGFDLSSGINGRLGYQRSQSEWNEQSGSQLAAGRDVYLEAGRDLALKDGTQVNAVREAYLVGGRDIIIRSAEHASKERSSGGGVTVGYNGGFYFGADGNASRGESEQYQNASVTAGQALVTDSGRDTTIIGGNLHGGNVQMSVGRNLDLISEQGAIDQKSASASFTVGSQYSANASGSTRDRLAVDRPATITADDRLHIDVAQNTHLKGSQIDSATGNLVLVTETLTHEDLKNSDKAGQGSFSYSGSSDGDTWGNKGKAQEGTGFNAGVPIAKFEGGDTRAAIGEGTIRNHEGEELQTDISRDVAGAHEETDSAAISQYSAKSELLGIAAQKGFEAIGDFASKQALEAEYKATQAEANGNVEEATYWRKQAESWKEGSTNKILLHAVVGALLGEASGVGAVAGGSAAAANQTLSGYLYEFLKEQGVVDGDSAQQRKTIGELTALIVGGVVGGSSGSFGGGASIALHGDKYNRQLHPFELEALRKLAKDESKSPESPLTEQQWYDKLLVQALRQVDSTYAAQLGADDPLAQLVLGRVNISVTDEEGRVIQLFQGGAEFENHARYAEHIRYGAEDYDRALKSWVSDRASKTPGASASLIMLINAYRDGGKTESDSSRVRVIDHLLSVKPDVVYALSQAELAKELASNRGDRIAASTLEREIKELKAVLNETLLTSLNKAKADGILPADLQDMNIIVLSDALNFDTITQTWAEDRVGAAVSKSGYNVYGSLTSDLTAKVKQPLTDSNAFSVIDVFRGHKKGMEALGDRIPIRGDQLGTVAVVEVDGRKTFGVNSSALINSSDKELGRQWRDVVGLSKGQDIVVFHAEAHSLMRAYEKTGGNLPAKMTMYVDRLTCSICSTYLPELMHEMKVDTLDIVMKNGAKVTINSRSRL